jgi:hypothetical protein
MNAGCDSGEREENRYLDPAGERYATQLAAVVFGWGPWQREAETSALSAREGRSGTTARDRAPRSARFPESAAAAQMPLAH